MKRVKTSSYQAIDKVVSDNKTETAKFTNTAFTDSFYSFSTTSCGFPPPMTVTSPVCPLESPPQITSCGFPPLTRSRSPVCSLEFSPQRKPPF